MAHRVHDRNSTLKKCPVVPNLAQRGEDENEYDITDEKKVRSNGNIQSKKELIYSNTYEDMVAVYLLSW
jgi:hypothetical protein